MNNMDFLSCEAQPALERLIAAAGGYSGQSRHVRRLLLGLYNAWDWPFELNRLRALDQDLAMDAVVVITASISADQELHNWVPNGDRIFQDYWKRESADSDWEEM